MKLALHSAVVMTPDDPGLLRGEGDTCWVIPPRHGAHNDEPVRAIYRDTGVRCLAR